MSDRLPNFPGLSRALASHEANAIVPIGFESVMRRAPQRKIARCVLPSLRPRLDVSKLKSPGLVATVPVLADKPAAPVVAGPHLAPRRSCDVTCPTMAASGLAGSRFVGHASLALLNLGQERVERALDDRGGVAIRYLVREQSLEPLELVVAALADRHLKLPAARSEGHRVRIAAPWGRCGLAGARPDGCLRGE